MARRALIAAWLIALGTLRPAPVLAQTRPSAGGALRERIELLIAQSTLGETSGLTVVDLATGRSLLEHHTDMLLNPASNLKLLTAATALLELGADFRMQTSLLGRVQGARVDGGLCLKGQADPTLTRAQLAELAQRLHEEGVRDVDELVIDGSYFDAQILPPAYEQQPNEAAAFRAPVSAVAVNNNAYTLRLKAGAREGAPVTITVDGPGYFQIDNALVTARAGAPKIEVTEREIGEERLVVTLRGTVPLGDAPQVITRRVPAPLAYVGQVFADVLQRTGIKPARIRIGTCASDAPLFASVSSAPLGQVVARLGKDSDNFAAEMLLKTLAAEKRRKPGTSTDGVALVLATLHRLKLPCEGISLVNGSGLFQGNRVTSQLLSQLLVSVYKNAALRDDFLAHLAVGGVDGTLARRFRTAAVPRVVRAKTGTLDDVIALSGYVLGPKPERAYAFSFLINGAAGKHEQARGLVDQVVETLTAHLYGRPLPRSTGSQSASGS
ncbi:MAG: D-alanyl-D-alanine carboxypeptidase/D-alanyl-D-alanine-endopeptidase, partial [Polyangiales bacterium]